MTSYTCLPDLIQGYTDGYERYYKDANSIKVVIIRHPQDDAKHLKYIEGIEDLHEDQDETGLKGGSVSGWNALKALKH